MTTKWKRGRAGQWLADHNGHHLEIVIHPAWMGAPPKRPWKAERES